MGSTTVICQLKMLHTGRLVRAKKLRKYSGWYVCKLGNYIIVSESLKMNGNQKLVYCEVGEMILEIRRFDPGLDLCVILMSVIPL